MSLQRIFFSRDISYSTVIKIINHGNIIENYKDSYPCPSVLLGLLQKERFFIVVAKCKSESVVITVYSSNTEDKDGGMINETLNLPIL